ncbi:MAG: hypothetical protein ACR2RD_02325 [Woeseiaceae bacterium]
MNKFFQRLKQEILGVIPTAIFFFVAFQLLALTRTLILREYEIPIDTFFAATVGALIIAKVVVVVDLLPFVNRFPDKPLIYNVLWKTAIYFVAAILVRYAEHLISFVRKYGNFADANSHLVNEVVWPHFWLVQIWLFVILLIYCVLTELARVFGRERVRAVFLGPANLGTH